MRNKLLRRGRRLTPEEQIWRIEMIKTDIQYIQNLFGVVLVDNEISSENI